MSTIIREIDRETLVHISTGHVTLGGNLTVPKEARGMVVFAHGNAGIRHSYRNRYVADFLLEGGLATLLMDLLTVNEEVIDPRSNHLRFNINLLAERLVDVTDWLAINPETRDLRIGYFGASTGAAAALAAAAERPTFVGAIVSRGGRARLAGQALSRVVAPTLFIAGGEDLPIIGMNQEALAELRGEKKLVIITGATHLFDEPGALDEVARLACKWFKRYLIFPHSGDAL